MNEEIVKRLFAEAESLSKNLVRVDSIVYDSQQELNNIEELYAAGKIEKSDYKKEKRRLQNVISTKSETYRSLRERFDQIESDYSKYEKDAKTKNDNPINQSKFEIYENELRGKYLNTVEQQEPTKKKKANYIIPIAVVAAIAIACTSYVAGAKSHDGNIISISQKKDEDDKDKTDRPLEVTVGKYKYKSFIGEALSQENLKSMSIVEFLKVRSMSKEELEEYVEGYNLAKEYYEESRGIKNNTKEESNDAKEESDLTSNLKMVKYLENLKIYTQEKNSKRMTELEKIVEEEGNKTINLDVISKEFSTINTNTSKIADELIAIYKNIEPLSDATDDKQVEARAKYICENYLWPTLKAKGRQVNESSPDVYEQYATIETVANIIRVYNDELPIENGVKTYSENTIDKYVEKGAELFANLGSLDDNGDETVYSPYQALIFEDNTDAARYAAEFDICYKMIANARNNSSKSDFIIAVKNLTYNLRDSLAFNGLYGSLNPLGMEESQLYAMGSAIDRFSGLVFERSLTPADAICIDFCKDAIKNKTKFRSSVYVYDGILAGNFLNLTPRAAGNEHREIPHGKRFYKIASDLLEKKYTEYLTEKGISYTKK